MVSPRHIPYDEDQRIGEAIYFSIYRGIVNKVRYDGEMPWVKAIVPALGGIKWETNWALPVLPGAYGYAYQDRVEEWRKSGTWMRPRPGDGVWIAFEHGNIKNPIYLGFWYFNTKMPTIFHNEEYLDDLPYGGSLDKTAWAESEGVKQTPREEPEKPEETEESEGEPKPTPPENAPRFPKTAGIKLHGFFMLIHYFKKHLRLHTPRRQYILLDDDSPKRPSTRPGLCITIHSEGRIELVEDARYNVPHGPIILAKYNAHQHCDMPGALGTAPCTHRWVFLTDLSQTVFSDTAPRHETPPVTTPQDDGSEDV